MQPVTWAINQPCCHINPCQWHARCKTLWQSTQHSGNVHHSIGRSTVMGSLRVLGALYKRIHLHAEEEQQHHQAYNERPGDAWIAARHSLEEHGLAALLLAPRLLAELSCSAKLVRLNEQVSNIMIRLCTQRTPQWSRTFTVTSDYMTVAMSL